MHEQRISSAGEREYYDRWYAQFLARPESELRCDRRTIERDLDNPAHPIYERRRLYQATLRTLLAEPVRSLRALDYGCGTGDFGLVLAGEGAAVTFLDLSPVAVEVALRRAQASGVAERATGCARDAEDLSCFEDGAFDLIFASAALHHALKYPRAFGELVRVLQPGGRLVLSETFGNNPALGCARRLRARLAREPEEAGEGIVFGDAEVELLRREFREVSLQPLNLLAMCKRLCRGHFRNPLVRGAVRMFEAVDAALLAVAPGLERYCGEVVVVARK